jgi:hypothetical protein
MTWPSSLGYFLFFNFLLLRLETSAQCQFSIIHTTTSDHCLYATEEVVWNKSSKINVSITGNTVTKNAGSNGGSDAGAASINTVKTNGWATTVIAETGTSRIFGLSATGPHINATSSIQYGFQIRGDNFLDIIEGTTYTNTGFSVVVGTVLKIWNDRGTIKFYVDSSPVRFSSATPPATLIVDAVLQSTGATISNVKVTNGTDGSFVASVAAGDLGTGVKYEWFKNAVSAGAASSANTSFTDATLTDGDVITCQLTQTGGCSASAFSNSVTFKVESPSIFGDYYMLNSELAYVCLQAIEQVTAFTNTASVKVTGNNLTKILATDGIFNAGAQSVAQVVNNGYAQTTINETNTLRIFGLSPSGTDNSFATVKYGYYIRGDGKLQAIDQGSLKSVADNDTYVSGEILKIHIDNNSVKYYRGVSGTTLAYISSTSPAYPLYVDIAFNNSNATINNVMIGNGSAGTFAITASPQVAGASFDWKLNGSAAPGATNSFTYSNTSSLTNGDLISCIIKPGQTGCALTTPAIKIESRTYGGDFYINNSASTIACAETAEDVQFTNLVGAISSANTVTKFQGGDGQWNAGATSLNKIYNNGYAEVDIKYTNRTQIFGISSAAAAVSNPNDGSIQFGFEFFSNGTYFVVENGVNKTSYIGYAVNNAFRIKIDNNSIKYYQIVGGVSTLVYTSLVSSATIAAAIPYVVDVSLNTQSNPVFAEISNARVSNGSNGIFVANAANVGASPVYQWMVNGIDISGANSSTYSDASLVLNDQVTCTLVPDIAGCHSSYVSNKINVTVVGGTSSPTSNWTGNISTAWDVSGNWDNGIPAGYTKATIPNGRARYPSIGTTASVYDLTIGSSASLSITGTNQLTVFDLWDNQGTFNAGSSQVNLVTCTNNKNTIKSPSAGETFYNLVVNNSNHVDAYSSHNISHQLTLTSGIVTLINPSDRIIINSGATVSGASSNSFVDGKVTKYGNVVAEYPFDFPTGDNGVYRKLTISKPSLVTDNFTAQYFKASASALTTNMDPLFYTYSGCEYWQLLRTGGASDVQVTLSWKASDCNDATYITSSGLAALRVAHLNDSDPLPANHFWENKGNNGTTGDNTAGTVSSISSVGAYGYFTLASVTNGNTLPIQLVDFQVTLQLSGVELTWKTAVEQNNDFFEVQRSSDGIEFSRIGMLSGSGTSKEAHQYSFIDHNPKYGRNYYRLKQVDYDGHATFSSVEKIDFDNELSFRCYPNPVRKSAPLYVTGGITEIMLIDVVYKTYVKQLTPEGNFDTSDLVSGIYMVSNGRSGFDRIVIY